MCARHAPEGGIGRALRSFSEADAAAVGDFALDEDEARAARAARVLDDAAAAARLGHAAAGVDTHARAFFDRAADAPRWLPPYCRAPEPGACSRAGHAP